MFCALACASPPAYAQQQGGMVSGRVTLDGKTAAGVEAVLLPDGNERRLEVARTITDAEGRFRLSVERAGRYRVMPFAPAYVSSDAQNFARAITVAPGDEIADTDFALVLGGVIAGQITAPDGRPAIAERVALTPVVEAGRERPTLSLPSAILETDDRGVYRVFGLPPGRYLVSAGADSAAATASAEVDARGNFVLEGLAAGEYELVLGARRPAAAVGGTRFSAARQAVRLADDSASEVTLVFEPGAKDEQ